MKKNQDTKNIDSENRINFTEIINGAIINNFVSKNRIFILFVFLLVIAYISNSYNAESVARRSFALEEEVKQLKAEYIENVSNNMYSRLQTQTQKKIDSLNMNLKISKYPPKKIVVDYD
ncbi:MAG: hypothetical protein HN704_00050 [Bacteroidetes bacterium]|jgi:hypothetical protein|nr:hypothetical protein [Bacteroidota bacterium]MBT6684742.1 hypothetical protein [Bacteroidota bacterium]MBT7143843.1 hypothetical protein [Bacteroidota bacterium]MBT7489976.1 hypothetical protein [Bacteroidota bacterium]